MALDPTSLRRVADQVAADESAKREARLQPKKQKVAAEFPALFSQFIRELERFVETAAACGSHSVKLLHRNTIGSDHLYITTAFSGADGPEATRACEAAGT